MKPALTVEQWARGYTGEELADDPKVVREHFPDFHAVAALCLHEQPFGFTREDVEVLRAVAAHHAKIKHAGVDRYVTTRTTELADRIESLLPPEKK